MGKPIIASGWSGHIDFLDKNSIVLLGGKIRKPYTIQLANNWLIKEAQWFQVEPKHGISALKEVYKRYKQYSKRSKKSKVSCKN